ncbi:MAG: ABC transporter permease [Flaviflexus sp.]|uniref:ABC transporter permease n=1 Tax=Flaviflexus ciconiae TaxID=2496867 RepID=A0A3Q9G304_9ACTO|nr:ABC transporter permease [Flaviflexus ciconiae]AZQ76240.1 ABC transporter permease [Flaviflexus ciconiae]
MNWTMYRIEFKRILRDPASLFFIVALPAFMFIIFGSTMEWAELRVGNGNIAMSTMIAMSAYGAATATSSVSGMAAVEKTQGWGRQLALTPMKQASYVGVKTLLAMTIAAIPIGIIYLLGFFLKSEATGMTWLLSAIILVIGSMTFALYGLVFGLYFKSETAASVSSGILVILAFLGNLFVPLSGLMLTIGKLTPMYGYAALARYPLYEGTGYDMNGNEISEPLWQALLNFGIWTALFAGLCVYLVRKGTARV